MTARRMTWWQAARFLRHLRWTGHYDRIVYDEDTDTVRCTCGKVFFTGSPS